jgi:hypothetical protein
MADHDPNDPILEVTREWVRPHWDSGWPDYEVWSVLRWDRAARVAYRCGGGTVVIEQGINPDTNLWESREANRPQVDATEQDQADYKAHAEALEWLRAGKAEAYNIRREAANIRKGDEVEVFKGRKIPKGVYFVCYSGRNTFGDFLHLSTNRLGQGDYHRYIAADNCRKLSGPQLKGLPFGGFLDDLASNYNREAAVLPYLADAMADACHPLAEVVRDLGAAVASGKYSFSNAELRRCTVWDREKNDVVPVGLGAALEAVANNDENEMAHETGGEEEDWDGDRQADHEIDTQASNARLRAENDALKAFRFSWR